MADILTTFLSKSGNTSAMAQAVAEGAQSTGVTVDLLPLDQLHAAQLLDYEGYAIGTPVYYGLPAAPIKQFFDESVSLHGRLAGRPGIAFASSANLGGGNETAVLAILQMMLVHGMIVLGAAQGDHYGPVALGKPDDRALKQCHAHGKRLAEMVRRLG